MLTRSVTPLMTSPSDRMEQIERELQKYNVKKANAKTLAAIGSNIGERIKILNDILKELMDISREQYYYDMVDYLGNLRIEKLKLSHCQALTKELVKATEKFIEDREPRYLTHCEKLKRRLNSAALNIIKEILRTGRPGEDIRSFYLESPATMKESIRKCYFIQRTKDIEKNIKICENDVEKNHQLLIMGEIIAYETILGDSIDTKIHTPGTFGFHILTVFRGICTKRNHKIIREILHEIAKKGSITKVDELFMSVAKQHYARYTVKSVEI